MTPALLFRVIEKRNFHGSMGMSYFAWNMGMSFFGMPLAQTWLARTQYHAKDAILFANEKRYSQSRARAGLIYS
jgi:hypothetical protein